MSKQEYDKKLKDIESKISELEASKRTHPEMAAVYDVQIKKLKDEKESIAKQAK